MTEAKMYIGPSRPYGVFLMENTIILDPKGIYGLEKLIEERPEIDTLIVPVLKLFEARKELKKKGSELFNTAQKVLQESLKLRKV